MSTPRLAATASTHLAVWQKRIDLGLSETDFIVLCALVQTPNKVTATDMHSLYGINRNNVSRSVAGMTTRRLVVAARDSVNRRLVYIEITQAGRNLLTKVIG